jgi:hypothetical protein
MQSCRRLKEETQGVRNGLIVTMEFHSDPPLIFKDVSSQ